MPSEHDRIVQRHSDVMRDTNDTVRAICIGAGLDTSGTLADRLDRIGKALLQRDVVAQPNTTAITKTVINALKERLELVVKTDSVYTGGMDGGDLYRNLHTIKLRLDGETISQVEIN